MKVVNFNEAKNDSKIVFLINKIFHDVDALSYKEKHPEIYSYEKQSWAALFSRVRNKFFSNKPVSVLDVGTGVGFVPLAVADLLLEADTVILGDISEVMLEQAKINCSQLRSHVREFVISDTYTGIESESVDIVTLNSVLHHISDVDSFFSEMSRVLKPGGIIIIKHEPNIRFVRNYFLRNLFKSLRFLQKARSKKVSKVQGVEVVFTETMRRLKDEGVTFSTPISPRELQALVDIHSPTAKGDLDVTRGFDPLTFVDRYSWPGKLVEFNSYGFLGKIRDNASLGRRVITSLAKRLFPNDGYYFDVVLQKIDN